MNKSQFMELLDYYFRNVDRMTYQEIKNDYEEHFRIGKEEGKTEEEISKELGNPSEIYQECKESGILTENKFSNLINMIDLDSITGFFKFDKKKRREDEEREYDIKQQTLSFDKDYHRIEIRTEADVTIKTHPEDRVELTYNTSDESYEIQTVDEDHKLKIGFELGKNSFDRLFNHDKISSMEILIPENSDLGLNIATVNGKVDLQVGENDITCNSVSGDVNIDCKSSNVNIKTISGHVKVKGVRKDLFVNTAGGDVEVYSYSPSINVNTVAGDIIVNLEENKEVRLKTVSGKIDLNLAAKKGKLKATSISGEIIANGSYQEKSKTKNKMFEFAYDTSDDKISLATVSGEIKVK